MTKSKNKASTPNTKQPKLERFKYEVAQEMGISSRSKTVNKVKKAEQLGPSSKDGKTF